VESNTKKYEDQFLNPMIAAERGFVDDIIQPSEVRKRIIEDLEVLRTKEETRPWRRHGCMPL